MRLKVSLKIWKITETNIFKANRYILISTYGFWWIQINPLFTNSQSWEAALPKFTYIEKYKCIMHYEKSQQSQNSMNLRKFSYQKSSQFFRKLASLTAQLCKKFWNFTESSMGAIELDLGFIKDLQKTFNRSRGIVFLIYTFVSDQGFVIHFLLLWKTTPFHG